ncbi:MAG: DNA polymerase IV [Bacteroidales bacterium]|jgi:DNA polymerase-4|nr:DNA polymerase IV [Bacteroidales bacterium]MCI2133677.1 DNA polymerase IV [Bacteroidales bacterium]
MEPERIIFHIDVNSAFLSWTAVKMLREGQDDIRLIPAVISGDPSDRRSIIAAASIPAKKLGIKTAQPVSMALRTCPTLRIVRGDWDWYKQCSRAFIEICRSYSPILQQFSIDECFIDMSGRLSERAPVEVATELKDRISTSLGFTVNVGIGPNKLLAKMASDFQKPDKVHTLWHEEIPQKMWPLEVQDLLWVGKKTADKLYSYGIRTIGALAKAAPEMLAQLFGKTVAIQMHEYANGRDDSPVQTESQPAKSISAERTFAKDITDSASLDKELFKAMVVVAHRLRMSGFHASCVSVFVKYTDFTVAQKQCTLPTPSDVTAVLLNEARALIPQIWDGYTPIRQVGVGVSRFSSENYIQLSLFEDPKMEYYCTWDKEYDASH